MSRGAGVSEPGPAGVESVDQGLLSQKRIPAVDGLRAFAIMFLIIGHYGLAWPSLPFVGRVVIPVGYAIVILFVLTGFAVTAMLGREYDERGDVAVLRFFGRKLLRAYPTLLAFTVLTTIHHSVSGVDVPTGRVLSMLGFGGNYYNGLATGDETRHLVGHLWSLAVGAQFLFIWAPLVAWGLRAQREKLLMVVAGAVVLGSLGSRLALLYVAGAPEIYIYNASHTRMDALAIGALLALLMRAGFLNRVVTGVAKLAWLPWVAVALLVISLTRGGSYSLGPGITVNALLTAAVLLMGVAAGWRGWLESRPIRLISVLSYSLFVWHVYGLAFDGVLGGVHLAVRVPLVLAITGCVAGVMHLMLERPFYRAVAWAR